MALNDVMIADTICPVIHSPGSVLLKHFSISVRIVLC